MGLEGFNNFQEVIMINSKRFLIFVGVVFIGSQCFATEMPAQPQEDWRYYISVKTMEKWLGKDRQNVDANLQAGMQRENIKYELEIKQAHPNYSGFNLSKNRFHETKQRRTSVLANFYYEMPLVNDISFSPFIGAGVHNTKITKKEIKLRPAASTNIYSREYTYRSKVKRGLVYNVGAEVSYAFTENVYGSLGWHMEEFLNAKLSGKRYNEQRVYLKLGYCFK